MARAFAANSNTTVAVPIPMACSTRDMRLVSVPLPLAPQELEEGLTRALYQSAAISREDLYADPIHYWFGMWGKLVILSSISRQGFHRKLDPETSSYELDWDGIYREVYDRTPNKMKMFFTVGTCRKWFKNRIDVYRQYFPAYRCYCESAVDNLSRHYAEQLVIMMEMQEVEHRLFYWKNLHMLQAAQEGKNEAFSRLLLNCDSASAEGVQPHSLIASSFCSFAKVPSTSFISYSTGSSAGVSPNCTNGEEKIVSQDCVDEPEKPKEMGDMEVEVDASEPLAFNISTNAEGKQNVCIKIYAPAAVNSPQQSSSKEGQGHYHPVFEHNRSGDSSSNELPAADFSSRLKRPSDTIEDHRDPQQYKRLKIIHKNRSYPKTGIDPNPTGRLLNLFNQFRSGTGLMFQISWVLAKTASYHGYPSEVWPCGFFMANIEEKIKNKEIVDYPTMLHACRCLLTLYALGMRNLRKLPKDIIVLRRSLKTAADHFKEKR